ncbi:ATP-binding protein [Paraconexibacter algicola]|uniref:Uncharacterized protein n=1 Tax=Paraconexibacter algicola TaxID=2133960 RepID=A0A2T4UHM3_9ACTN|nr:ATP-binding protein [Paraconexibacter algicola]PTL58742.1 hypothetical protein C7Y72_03305 [Paraconexibacter algicola]
MATAASDPATSAPARTGRSLRGAQRTGDGAVLAGVCAGLARALDLDPRLVRVVAVVLGLSTGGAGIGGYLLAWTFMSGDATASPSPQALGWRVAAGAGMLAASVVLALQELGAAPDGAPLLWPVVLTVAGVVLLWRSGQPLADPAPAPALPTDEGRWRGPGGAGAASGRALLRELPGLGPRTLAGIALIAAGLVALLEATNAIGTLRDLVVAGAIVLAGVTLIFGSSWLGLLSTLREERAQRIRSEERAEMAAHLHDSVLQTLALIQRRAGDDREVATLARRQERELRDWLSGRGQEAGGATTLTGALRAAAADVEERHAVTVEVVTVGDVALDDHVAALVRATGEAAVNAAKFAGTGRVDVFAEVGPERVEVFVRDRGAGFDPDTVPEDRRGLRESIVGRMARHGGRAVVRSAPGEGTEVELVLDRPEAGSR